jgi:hypothetical protein
MAHPARLFGCELFLHDFRHDLGLRAVVDFLSRRADFGHDFEDVVA